MYVLHSLSCDYTSILHHYIIGMTRGIIKYKIYY